MNDIEGYAPEEVSAAKILTAVYERGFKDGRASVRTLAIDILAAPPLPLEEQVRTAALPLDSSVAELGLATRPLRVIRQDGIHTIGDLMERYEEDLKDIRGLGPTGFANIHDKLALVGYRLRPGYKQ